MRYLHKPIVLLLLALMLVPQIATASTAMVLCPMGESSGPCGCGHTEPIAASLPGTALSDAGCCKILPPVPLDFVRLDIAERVVEAPLLDFAQLDAVESVVASDIPKIASARGVVARGGPPLHLRIAHFLI